MLTIHEGEKSFKCEISLKTRHKRTWINSNLEMHMLTIKEDKKSFKCEICKVKFLWKPDIKEHVESVHGVFKCETCDTRFFRKNELKNQICSWGQKTLQICDA